MSLWAARAPKVLLALLAAAVLSGCATIRLAYENADTYLRWRANSYLNLEGGQAEELVRQIHALHDWHRAKALPQYAALSEQAGKRVAKGLSREDLVWGYDSAREQILEAVRQAAERAGPLLDRLTAEQVAHLEKRLAEDNRKFARENLRGSEQERRKRRALRIEGQLEDWVGRLTEEQAARVRQYSDRAPLYDELRDKDRKRLQGELLEMVRARQAQERLPGFVAAWDRGRDPAYAAASQAARQEYYALLLDVDRMLTPEQRARVVASFRRYAQDFTALSARSAQ